ncbi:unnamed protein product, partial [Mesorhabditis spiculigera]
MARQRTLQKVQSRWQADPPKWATKPKDAQEDELAQGKPPKEEDEPVFTSDEDFQLFIREQGCLVHVRRIYSELMGKDIPQMFEAEINGVVHKPVAGKFHKRIRYLSNMTWDFCGWAVLHYETRSIAREIVRLYHDTDRFNTGVPVHVSLGIPKKQILDLFPEVHAAISKPDLDPSGPFPSRNRPVIVPNVASRKSGFALGTIRPPPANALSEDEGYFESRHTSADSLPQPQPVYDTKAIWVHRLPGNYDTQAVAERLRIREDEIEFDHTEPQIVLRYDPYDDRISALIYFLHQNVAKEFHAGWHNQMLDGKILETAYRKC